MHILERTAIVLLIALSPATGASQSSLIDAIPETDCMLSESRRHAEDARDLPWFGPLSQLLTGRVVADGEPFTVRVKFAAGAVIQPHSHIGATHLQVVSGSMRLGVGLEYSARSTQHLAPESIASISIGAHFAWFPEDAVIEFYGVGPWSVIYAERELDPRCVYASSP